MNFENTQYTGEVVYSKENESTQNAKSSILLVEKKIRNTEKMAFSGISFKFLSTALSVLSIILIIALIVSVSYIINKHTDEIQCLDAIKVGYNINLFE